MKTILYSLLLVLVTFSSCQSVRVATDYDTKIDFSVYKTYAFYKAGIDKVEISDLDKRRILSAIETQLNAKGFTKSETPDLLINIITKATEKVYVNQFNYGWGFGFGGFYGNPGFANTSSVIEGTLYIDIIDAKKDYLIWQGSGVGDLTQNPHEKDIRINEFVAKILAQYPPMPKTK